MSHIAPISFSCASTIPAYRCVTATTGTAYTVKVAAACTDLPLGITTDVAQDGATVPVGIGGVLKLQFNQTVGSGEFVISDSSGLGIAYAGTSAGVYVIGTYIGAAMATTGTVGDVLFNPFFISVS